MSNKSLVPGTSVRVIKPKNWYGLPGTILTLEQAQRYEPSSLRRYDRDFYFVLVWIAGGLELRILKPSEVVTEEIWNSPLIKALREDVTD
jgi:hypothetical protein